ncbi:hypothetical protein OB919_04160 [Halobacteria archaeon AArc-curdl1]|uniref:Uncharacterized protein n=1 Tax=Natronosalvus hydrolyticus TaxID=2979988 RepID=A0AAP3E5M3_9EURY|nr:hypothetical protein [Halobacteria archaeon AArc-curdl1]
MRRRALLAASGILVAPMAGCLGTIDGTGSACEPPESSEPTNEPGTGFPSIELLADESDRDHIAVATSILRHFDATGPARIEIVVQNTSDDRQQFTFLDWPPFPADTGFHSDGETGLFLAPEDGYQVNVPDEPADGCWHIADPPATSDVLTTVELDPCETISETYGLYHVTGDTCLKAGEYRFSVADVGAQGNEWGFTVLLE